MLDKNFTKLPNEFINDMPNLSHKAVRIYIALRKYVNENLNGDEVFPSYTTLQGITGLNRTSVAKAVKELINLGWIKSIDKGYNSVNHYHISSKKNLLVKSIYHSSTKSVPVEDFGLGDKTESLVHKMDSTGTQSGLSVVQKVNSNNTNITRLNNKTNIENPDFKTSNEVFQSEEGLIDSFKVAENSSVCSPEEDSSTHAEPACIGVRIGEFIPFPAEPADEGVQLIGEFLDNFIYSAIDNDKAVSALINSEEVENLESQ